MIRIVADPPAATARAGLSGDSLNDPATDEITQLPVPQIADIPMLIAIAFATGARTAAVSTQDYRVLANLTTIPLTASCPFSF